MIKLLAFLLSILCASTGVAQQFGVQSGGTTTQVEPWLMEFDARPLTNAEKTYIQAALASLGYYNGLLDGQWGRGSQSALDRYSSTRGIEKPTFLTVFDLVADFSNFVEQGNWQPYYYQALEVSFAIPRNYLNLAPSDSPYPWVVELEGESQLGDLAIILTWGDSGTTANHHTRLIQIVRPGRQPYTVRNDGRWVTSVHLNQGLLAYSRSEPSGRGWVTVTVIASESSSNLLNLVASSISRGRQNDWVLPTSGYLVGVMEAFVSAHRGNAETAETANDSQSNEATHSPSTGTGFFISESAEVLTNAHVVNECARVQVGGLDYRIVAKSEDFDLALLEPVHPTTVEAFARFADSTARLNSDVTAIGFPLAGLLGGINVTRGSVTSLSGIGGSNITMQISAPVQPGNSGGPLLDRSGNVVGVVVSKLDAVAMAELIGDIPQNINFAVRSQLATLFLELEGITPERGTSITALEPADLADLGASFTRLIECN